ncbi:unnamed protein product [Calicophoron daubneyi]|uniref:Polynucleotide 5'-hydroxyl-kinase NOL9 n=1 Tax=Calicophoron daubneyi TaxID=300641 RepID=A0AAV2TH32_CALDB
MALINTLSNASEFSVHAMPSGSLSCIIYNPNCHEDPTQEPFCIVFMTARSTCSIYGRLKLTHLCGAPILILGALLKADSTVHYPIFSPNSHAPVTIEQSVDVQGYAGSEFIAPSVVKEELYSLLGHEFASRIPEESLVLATGSGPCTCVFVCRPYRCRVMDSLSSVKRFKRLYSFDVPLCLPEDSKIRRTLGFCLRENDFTSGFKVSSDMVNLSVKFKSMVLLNSHTSGGNEVRKTNKTFRGLLIAGPKGAGKSSLLKYIANDFLTSSNDSSVAVLDCDIGQPEFTPCGMVSLTIVKNPLFGPPFAHQALPEPKPICQCFVGSITPSDDPSFYLDCLAYVFEAYKRIPDPKPPLLINTMGWTQGLGLTLLVEQIRMIRPDIVAQIQMNKGQSGARQNLPIMDADNLCSSESWYLQDLSREEFCHEVVVLSSMSGTSGQQEIPSSRCHFGPPDHRDLTMLAYFAATLANAPTSLPAKGRVDQLGHPVAHFLDCLPYRVPLTCSLERTTPGGVTEPDSPTKGALGSGSSFDESVSKDSCDNDQFRLAVCLMRSRCAIIDDRCEPLELTIEMVMSCINATVVALCAVPTNLIQKGVTSRSCAIIPFSPVCECLGLGICRAIDPVAGLLYLTTGVPAEDLVKVTGILRGNVNLPQCFFLEQPVPHISTDEVPAPVFLPYLGPVETQGMGRAGLPSRRSYPRTQHHDFHRTGSSEMFNRIELMNLNVRIFNIIFVGISLQSSLKQW